MMKKTIITTFSATFFIMIAMDLVLMYLMPGLGIVDTIQNNWYGVWLLFSLAAVSALVFTAFNYYENLRIENKYKRDVTALLDNDKPRDPDLLVVYDKLRALSQELQTLSVEKTANKAAIIEQERKRISRELHDSVSQELFAATMILSSVTDENMTASLTAEQMQSQTRMVLKILHQAQAEMRALLLHLRPIELDGKTLVSGLSALTDELQAKISANITVQLADITTSATVEDNLFRMAQEILSNTLRHAQADNIALTLREKASNIIMTIADDGVGFDPENNDKTASYGLANIKERALLLGGDAIVTSQQGTGTTVEIRIPNGQN